MRLILSTLLLLLASTASAELQKLADVFQVDTRDPAKYPSSCLSRLNAKARPLFDPKAKVTDQNNLLNKIWNQAYHLNSHVLRLTEVKKYNSNVDTRKLMFSFFSLLAHVPTGPGQTTTPTGFYRQKFDDVRRRYQGVQDLMDKAQSDGENKPKVFCDTTYAKWQRGSEPVRDKDGNKIKDENGKAISLKEWETSKGRDFDTLWYMWFDFGDERGYMVLQKKHYPPISATENYPWPIDPRTKEPSYCQNQGLLGWTWDAEVELPEGHDEGTDAWLERRHFALCPRSFLETEDRHHNPNLNVQPKGTSLDKMGITALTFYHELFHMVYKDMPDYDAWFPERQADGNTVPWFPVQKAAFKPSGHRTHGGIHCLTLAMYEHADVETKVLEQCSDSHNPESYVWFALAMLLQNFGLGGGQDWSNGQARKKGGTPGSITVSIPGDQPAGKNIARATDAPEYDLEMDDVWIQGRQDNKSITELARDAEPTVYHGADMASSGDHLASFHEMVASFNSTFVTSTKPMSEAL